MFPQGGNPELQSMLAAAQQMQAQLAQARGELAQATVQGSAGGGMVTATMVGSGEIVALSIDPQAIDPADAEGLADLVLAALRDAHQALGKLQASVMGPLAQGLGDLGREGDAGDAGSAGGGRPAPLTSLPEA